MNLRSSGMRTLALGILGVVLFSGCNPDTPAPHAAYPELIRGDWKLARAFRNASETRVLDSLYFRFDPGDQVATNLPLPGHSPVKDGVAAYRLIADSLLMATGGGQEQLFLINSLDSQRLVLSTLIMDHAFQFDLVRE